uniref:U3 small nucleolar RNA-associated protein 11 n=1 Tax=Caenorhabditis tropicalis TaxID=1561998 RepID=A0A1I7T5Q7_9PELO
MWLDWFRLRRTTLTSVAAPGDYKMEGGIPILTKEKMEALRAPHIEDRLKHKETVLSSFAYAEMRLYKQQKMLHRAFLFTGKPLTKKMNMELEKLDAQFIQVKTDRAAANKEMDFDKILKGIVMIDLYTLYLTTQCSELMTKP